MNFRSLSRRQFLATSAAASATFALPRLSFAQTPAASGEVSVTDVAGRTVTLSHPAERVIVTSRSGLYTLAVLERENPFQRLVAWNDDLRTTDKDTYNQYLAKFPEAADLPLVGNVGADDFNAELILDLEPDLIVIDLGSYQNAVEYGTIDILEAAGIAVAIVDFREHMLENTIPSVQTLGRLIGKMDVALAYSDFYLAETNKVYERVAAIDPEAPVPSMFIQRAPGVAATGLSFGAGNFGEFITRAGGINWAEQFISTVHGTVNPEQILVGDFDELLLTGANWSGDDPTSTTSSNGTFISMGYESTLDDILARTEIVIEEANWQDLPAVQSGHVHDIWHQFYISPYSFVAFQYIAKCLHPDLFADVDPSATFQSLHEQFLPIDYTGVFFADLAGESSATPAS